MFGMRLTFTVPYSYDVSTSHEAHLFLSRCVVLKLPSHLTHHNFHIFLTFPPAASLMCTLHWVWLLFRDRRWALGSGNLCPVR